MWPTRVAHNEYSQWSLIKNKAGIRWNNKLNKFLDMLTNSQIENISNFVN